MVSFLGRVTLELKNSTPMLVGWFDPEEVDPIGLRPSEIKGLWRWWGRAFVSGVLYDNDLLRGEDGREVLRRPLKKEVVLISKIVGEGLGLGMAIERLSLASRFTLYVEPLREIRPQSTGDRENEWQRIKLLTIKRRLKYIPVNTSFRLYIEWRRGFKGLETALKILIVSLQFTGVGKGSRRGLGSLDIVSYSTKDLRLDLERRSIQELFKEIYEECSQLVNEYVKRESIKSTGEKRTLPPMPVISREKIAGEGFSAPVTEAKIYQNVDVRHFVRVHNFFVRSERCKVLYNNYICDDDLKKNLHAWFLGLPRSQRRSRGDVTGYIIKARDIHRRPSPVTLALHTSSNHFGRGAYIATFLSGDWPRKLEWYRIVSEDSEEIERKEIEINDNEILRAYRDFSKEFNEYLNRLRIGQGVTVVWP